jgi:hypothetical protein
VPARGQVRRFPSVPSPLFSISFELTLPSKQVGKRIKRKKEKERKKERKETRPPPLSEGMSFF